MNFMQNKIIGYQLKIKDLYEKFNTNANQISNINNICFMRASCLSTGDVQFSGRVPFNSFDKEFTKKQWDSRNNQFILPASGVWYINFEAYTQPSYLATIANRARIEINGEYVTTSGLSSSSFVDYCNKGDRIAIAGQGEDLPLNFYAGQGHNHVILYKIN